MPGVSSRKVAMASAALAKRRPWARTWRFQPRSTMAQSASYRSIVMNMRPPPLAMR